MSIAKTKEAIDGMSDHPMAYLVYQSPLHNLGGGIRVDRLKALAASHTRLLEAAKEAITLTHRAMPTLANDLMAGLHAAVAEAVTEEAEKNDDDPVWMCKVCAAEPDNEGWVRHGKGCYQLSEDGGGEEYIEEAEK